jgi:AraC-like DNA-binding protein/CheY-like chemotaxis protein
MKPTILVVEDELIIAHDLKIILEQEGYNVIINITNVPDAIKAIDEYDPVLILLDINLKQDVDGISLGHHLLIKDIIPFIYITSFSDKLTVDRLKETRPHGVIIKPFKPVDILTSVSVVLNNYKHKKIDVIRSEESSSNEVPFMLKKVVKYIEDNLTERIDVRDLSKLTQWTNQHFIRVFTKYVGDTPYQYILKRKMEKAKVLITETDIPLNGIAIDLGFQSYGNFCKNFKKENGINPEIYRKKYFVNRLLIN